jgi:hypothetical protein
MNVLADTENIYANNDVYIRICLYIYIYVHILFKYIHIRIDTDEYLNIPTNKKMVKSLWHAS